MRRPDTRPARRSRPLLIAHRGSSGVLPEQTLAAYQRAIADGADALECDVRLTADGELVCLHDRTLERTGGVTGVVSTMTLAQLRELDWGAWRYPTAGREARDVPAADRDVPDPPRRVPGDGSLVTLRELVELAIGADRPIGLAVETKHPTRYGGRVERAVADLLREYGLDGPVQERQPWARVMSFSPLAVRRVSTLLPQLSPHQLVELIGAGPALPGGPVVGPVATALGGSLRSGARTAGLDIAIVRRHPEVVAAQHAAGHEVFVWTVDQPDDLQLCLELEVEAIITNHPQTALDVAGRTG